MQANKRVENAASTGKKRCKTDEKATGELQKEEGKEYWKKQDDVAGQIEGLDEPYKANRFCGDNNAKRVLKRLY